MKSEANSGSLETCIASGDQQGATPLKSVWIEVHEKMTRMLIYSSKHCENNVAVAYSKTATAKQTDHKSNRGTSRWLRPLLQRSLWFQNGRKKGPARVSGSSDSLHITKTISFAVP